MTTPDLARLMLGFGAVDAVNLDGGGSTTMVLADSGIPRLVNVPVGLNDLPGTERPVGNNLAVFAFAVPAPRASWLLFVGLSLGGVYLARPVSIRPPVRYVGLLAPPPESSRGRGRPIDLGT